MSVAASILPDEAAVVSKALMRAAEALGLSSSELAQIIGTSEATLSRIRNQKRGPIPLGSKEGELALLFLRVFRSLDALVGGNEAHAKAWLHAENHHLGGVPLGRMKKIEGLVDVAEYLDAMRGTI
ncbi:MAG: antitoxin Xre-like helix-turn-helix domain-containing protein [Polyangiales bacterium]